MTRIHLTFPVLPPALDGIGDHTARLAGALAEHAAVTVLTTPEAAAQAEVPTGVQVRSALRWRGRRTRHIDASGVAAAVADERPEALLLQYNPTSWGRRGLNPLLPLAVRAARRAHPALRVGLMVHETFYPRTTLRQTLLNVVQQAQLRALLRAAHVVFVSTEAWVPVLGRWAPTTPFVHLPVGSNIEDAGWTREAARAALEIPEETLVAGVFGTATRPDRLLPLVRAAAERLRLEQEAQGGASLVLYVGPDGPAARAALAGLPVRDLGALPVAEVSRALAALDLHLAPFQHGVSTRRGSFVAGLQHGVPSVSTRGPHTDRLLLDAAGTACLLTPEDDASAYADQAAALAADPARRWVMAEAARALYGAAFAWSHGAERVLSGLRGEPSAAVPVRAR
ncbi:MAG: glycosyltransferase [Rubricoccaceae bacterium]|nr:glycosyltransferase [Rubricoccaceae bacterium]